MGEDTQVIDQSQLAESLEYKIPYIMTKEFLVKPLEPVMVKKEFSRPVVHENKPEKDDNGVEAVDYQDVETEVKEVESDFVRGVVLKVPYEYTLYANDEKGPKPMDIAVGDVIIYPKRSARWFDHLKDTYLVRPFEIVCKMIPKG